MLVFLSLVAFASASSFNFNPRNQRYGQNPQPIVPRTSPVFFQAAKVSRPVFARPAPTVNIVPSGTSGNDCEVAPGPWGPCSAPCGGGVQKRTQQILKQPSGYGAKCPTLHEETQTCNNQPCAVDCQVEEGQFAACSATCGSGYQVKVDIIIRESKYGGLACPPESQLTSRRECQLPPCPVPVDCEIGYSAYSSCSAPCGGGTKSRSAYVIREAEFGGAPCPADLSLLVDTVSCNEDIPCAEPKDCEYITGNFGECSAACGQGYRKRAVWIVSQPEDGGRPCPSQLYETQPCQAGPCPTPTDCVVQWSPFSYCSATCNGGTQTANGQILTYPTDGGAPCPDYSQLQISRSCNNFPCPQFNIRDCEIEYGDYSQCSVTCGSGFQFRKGFVKNEAENGGLPCPHESTLVEKIPCNLQPCLPSIDCKVQRSYWSECSAPCGGGSQTRTVSILQQAQNGGHPCPSRRTETRSCNAQPCQAPPQHYRGNF